MARPILYSYFEKTAKVLEANYERSADQNASNNLGKNRENFCSNFLANVLPPKLKINSGEVWDSVGHKTGQLDLIITRDDAPALEFGSDNTYLAEGVFASIEVKSNLDRVKLIEAGNTLSKVEQLKINVGSMITIGKPLHRPLRIVFSYTGATWETLLDEINKRSWQELFDLISILDQGVLINKGRILKWTGDQQFLTVKGKAASVGFLYFYLTTYGTSFLGRNIELNPYFEPVGNWNE
ncbi:MAG: DUF6602 domain-containing protein [Bacteroidia bacterium]